MALDKFTTGAVTVRFKKDVPYFSDKELIFKTPVETGKLKGEAQFKKDERRKLRFDVAGKMAKAGYCEILDENKDPIDTVKVAKKK